MTQLAIGDAEATEHALSVCNALVQAACPIAFFIGDLEAGDKFVARLLDSSTKHALIPWHKWGRCFEGILLLKRGDTARGLELLGTTLGELPGIGYAVYRTSFLGTFAEALGNAGQPARGIAAIARAIQHCESEEERWCIPELLRIKGGLLLQNDGATAVSEAEEHYRRSLDWARRQGAVAWELRTATSLAGLLRNQNRTIQARDVLAPVYARFSEGLETADLKTARDLLDACV